MVLGTECILWTGYTNRGYARSGPKEVYRREWEKVYGPLPKGWHLDHICHDPAVCKLGTKCPHRRCINIDHLAMVPASENKSRTYRPNAEKTHCPQGHPYDDENTMVFGNGGRRCRQCNIEDGKRRRLKAMKERCKERGHKFKARRIANGSLICDTCAKQRLAGRKRDDSGRVV